MRQALCNGTSEWVSDRPSVLWRCWLGGRKGIRPVNNWVVGWWHGHLPEARCTPAYGPADGWCHCYSLSLASVKSSWYRLTRVVPERGPLNGCVCVCVCVCVCWLCSWAKDRPVFNFSEPHGSTLATNRSDQHLHRICQLFGHSKLS